MLEHKKECKAIAAGEKVYWGCVPGCPVAIEGNWEHWKKLLYVNGKLRDEESLKQILYLIPKPNITIEE